MSRRKQSNPKPIKREDEEWSDSEKTPSVSSGVDGGGSGVSSPAAQPGEDESSLPPPPRPNSTDEVRPRLQNVVTEDARKRLQVNKAEEIEACAKKLQDRETSLRTTRDLSPKCELTKEEEDEEDDDDIETIEDDNDARKNSSPSSSLRRKEVRRALGEFRRLEEPIVQAKRIKLDDDAPPKLRLNTSLATDPALRPATVAALTIQPDKNANPTSPLPPAVQKAIRSGRLFVLPSDSKEALTAEQSRPAPLICPPCGIRFSSASTLEAHQKVYCAYRPRVDQESGNDDDDNTDKSGKFEVRKAYACPHCSYSADKKVSLNRHMRMHAASPVPPQIQPPTTGVTPAAGSPSNGSILNEEAERYCRNCDIRFSSLKTYRAHKTHYCSTRHVVKDVPPQPSLKASPPGSSSPGDSPPPQPCLALPTNPILIVPYSLFRGASVLTAPALPTPDTPCFLLSNGALQPMTRGLPAPPTTTEAPTVLRAVNKPSTPASATPANFASANSAPLDLSVRRSSQIVTQDEKENRVSPAPSLPPPTGSPRSRGSSSPRARSLPTGQNSPSSAPPPTELALRLAELPPPSVPGVLVKQGVSRCKECNIVFCRHENFVAHKKHYCQARENPVSSPPPSGTPSPPLYQLICAPCGIKFASYDNLVAHQAFYCNKRTEPPEHQTRCPKCKTIIEPGTTHTCSIGPTGGWRCPVCGSVSPTAGAAQRHMDAHQGVKAFRCTICQYKGNTLRGMRTHIRMHFEKRGTDLQEETYITCVLADETTVPTPEPAPAITPEEIPVEPVTAQSVNGTSEVRKSPEAVPQVAKVAPTSVKQEREDTPPPEESMDPTKAGPRYCHSCDISFNYVRTFIAHKQYYCSSHAGEASNNNNTSTTNVQDSTTPNSTRTEASVL